MSQKDIEALHEQASSQYLEGDLEAALATWRRLLQANPDDERAREGVELCERMSGCESESVVTEGQSPFAVGATDEEADPDLDDEAAEPEPAQIEDPLDRLLDLGPTAPASPRAAAHGAGGEGGELDLSDLRDESEHSTSKGFSFEDLFPDASPASEESSPTPQAKESGPEETVWTFGEGPPDPEPEPEPELEAESEPMWPGTRPEPPVAGEVPAAELPPAEAAQPGSETGDTADPAQAAADASGELAAATLHRRASDLLATALEEMERGEKTAALQTLEGLLILDDQNFAARSLTQKLRAELDSAGAGRAEEGPPVEEIPNPGALDGMELEACDPLTLDPGATDGAASGEAGLGEDSAAAEVADTADTSGAAEPAGGGGGPVPVVPQAASPGRRFSLPSRKIWIPAAAVLVLGAGYLVWSLLLAGGGEPEPVEVPTRRAGAGKARPPAGDSTEKQPAEPGGGTEAVPPPKTVEEQVAEAVGQAETALASADYAAAVIALDEALALDPDNAEIRERLDSAGASYRVQQEKKARWDQAVRDFDHGDFQAALSYFYRLPEEEQSDQVARYKLNGWYNLGVLALKNRDCEDAGSHFREARDLAPEDPQVTEALELARRCSREGSPELRAAISGLEYRGVGGPFLGPGAISDGSAGGP